MLSMFPYLSLIFFLALILLQATTVHVIIHPVAIANTRTTITAATDPPSTIFSAEFSRTVTATLIFNNTFCSAI